VKLVDVIEELVEERGLDRSVLRAVVEEGLLAAYAKKYPSYLFKAETDRKKGEVAVLIEKKVVATPEDEDQEIGLKKARFVNKDAAVGDMLWLPFEKPIGRIEVLWARQIIAQKIRKIEADAIYNKFKGQQGEVVVGVVNKCERNGVVVKIGDASAFLPYSLSIPNEKCVVGFSLRALLKEVLPEPRGDNQLILDRASEEFVAKLFQLEFPEVFEGIIEIKKIVRIAGYKSKVMVVSHDLNIDPVGTCVGIGGSRIQPILKELENEKIDVVAWSPVLETLVKGALKPAKIDSVEIVDGGKVARVFLDDDQRSLAIGKMGQNIALASRLCDMDIQLVQRQAPIKKEVSEEFEQEAWQQDDVD
jgi:N utilization substance protein A